MRLIHDNGQRRRSKQEAGPCNAKQEQPKFQNGKDARFDHDPGIGLVLNVVAGNQSTQL